MSGPAPVLPKLHIDYDDGKFWVRIPFAINYLIQGIPDRRWHPGKKLWAIEHSWRTKAALEKLLSMPECSCTVAARDAIEGIAEERPVVTSVAHVDYEYKTEPFDHQREGVTLGYNREAFGLFFEQGLGKTKTAIDLMAKWYLDGDITRVMVVCPVSIRSVWVKEFETHCPIPYSIQRLDTKKWPAYRTDVFSVLLVGVESLSQGGAYAMALEWVKTGRDEGGAGFIVDESSKIKNSKAIRTSRCIELSAWCAKRLILTGTPVTQGVQDLYTQFQVLDRRILGMKSFYTFRNRYCVMGGFENKQIIAYKNIPELMELIEPHCMRVDKEDALDLPPKTFQTRLVSMTGPQAKAYKELKKNLQTTIDGHDIEVEMVLEAYLRLQQFTGGHIPIGDGEVVPMQGKNPKLEELVDVMSELRGRKVVIWARFRPEVEAIKQRLIKEGYNVCEFHGGLDESQKAASVEAIQAGGADVLILTPQAGAYGLTLTAAHTAIYYSIGFSLEEFLQSQDRIHRIGQEMSCSYILLGCENTVDTAVHEVLLEKKSLADFIADRIKNGVDLF